MIDLMMFICIARTEENGVEPAPVERGADRGRRGRGRGELTHSKNISFTSIVLIWDVQIYVYKFN